MGLKSVPSVLQLPGGVVVRARKFRITTLDAHDRPTAFELVADDEPDFDCTLWVADFFLGTPLPRDLLSRVRARIEDSIEPPEHVTQSRTYDMNKFPGEG